jgi:hypothetical protein
MMKGQACVWEKEVVDFDIFYVQSIYILNTFIDKGAGVHMVSAIKCEIWGYKRLLIRAIADATSR